MKTFTKKMLAVAIVAIVTTMTIGLNAQVRWDPSKIAKASSSTDGTWTIPDSDKRIAVCTYPAGSDPRSDFRYTADAHFITQEPFLVIMATVDNCFLKMADWKIQIMYQRQGAIPVLDGDGNPVLDEDGDPTYVMGTTGPENPAGMSFTDNKREWRSFPSLQHYKILGCNWWSVVASEVIYEEEQPDIWVVNIDDWLTGGESGYFLGLGDRTVRYAPNGFDTGRDAPKTTADRITSGREWIEFVNISGSADPGAKLNLHYFATIEDPEKAVEYIERYKATDGGLELRDVVVGPDCFECWCDPIYCGDCDPEFEDCPCDPELDPDCGANSVKGVKSEKGITIYQNNNRVLATNTVKMEAYDAAGVLVLSANANEITLPAGFYIIKAYNCKGESFSVKALIQ